MYDKNKMALDRDEAIEILSSIKASTLSVHAEIMKNLEKFVEESRFELTSSIDVQKEIGVTSGISTSEGHSRPVITVSISHFGEEASNIPLSISDTAELILKLQHQFNRAMTDPAPTSNIRPSE